MTAIASDPRIGTAAAEFLKRKHQLFIDGAWVDAVSGATFETFNPSTGAVIGEVAEGAAADVDRAVDAARRAFRGAWSKVTPAARSVMMWKLADLIEQNKDELAELESYNNGKPLHGSRFEIGMSIDVMRYTAGWATKLTGETITLSAPGTFHAFTVREPIGVVGQIIPWNSPLMMAVWKLAPALATGCTVVLKPAEQTPLTALRLAELTIEAGIPSGVVNVIPGFGETAGAAISAHPDIDKVAFTGSGEVGRLILTAAAGNFKKVSLELGGKSPVIVFPDADLSAVIPGAARAIFNNAGQVCAAGSRLFAHKKIFDRVVEGIAGEAGKLRVGHALSAETQMGPLVSEQQVERVTGFITEGRAAGATVVTGGGRVGDEGYFVSPTVLTGVTPDMSVYREEVFGPVLCAMSFDDDDLDRIADDANNTMFGLAGSVWTRDLSTAHKMVRRIRAGTVGVNMHGSLDAAVPFGGFKQSGWGREKGREVLDLYTETKTVLMSL